ncbi:Argininosuccinate lyase [Rhynchospora pubera]|uniref:Argininosuccinate lyase n=1 Tax=Rhynchospora pubera TaxID=906938 RepID=A0AAV8HJ12_9POAL|nr:Argininosuccinate lyase [Rhynchospora pubera]
MAFSRVSPVAIATSFSLQLRSSSLSPITFSRFRFSRQKSLPLVLPSLAFETLVKSVNAKGESSKGRSEDGVNEKVGQFTDSVSFEAEELWIHYIRDSISHANMLADQELITVAERDLIIEGLRKIEKMIESGEFVWRKHREDVHMNIEAALTDMIGQPAKKLLIGRSRNEQVATVLRLWCCDAIDGVRFRIKQLKGQFTLLDERNFGRTIEGNTCLRSDKHVILHSLLLSYINLLEEDSRRLKNCKDRLKRSPLRVYSFFSTRLPINRPMRSQELGFIATLSNCDAVTARDFVFDLLFANFFTALDLFQICEKWVLFSNPIESWMKSTTDDIRSLLDSFARLPSADNPNLQEEKKLLFNSVNATMKMLEETSAFFANITFNDDTTTAP